MRALLQLERAATTPQTRRATPLLTAQGFGQSAGPRSARRALFCVSKLEAASRPACPARTSSAPRRPKPSPVRHEFSELFAARASPRTFAPLLEASDLHRSHRCIAAGPPRHSCVGYSTTRRYEVSASGQRDAALRRSRPRRYGSFTATTEIQCATASSAPSLFHHNARSIPRRARRLVRSERFLARPL